MNFRNCWIIIIIILFCNCSKKVGLQTGLIGSWKLSEVFDGYLMGGNFAWNKVDPSDSKRLQFSSTGGYTSLCVSSNQTCTGNFVLQGNDILTITSDCQLVPLTFTITELTPSSLILDITVREGIIRSKYIR